jgi:hypothetical protein
MATINQASIPPDVELIPKTNDGTGVWPASTMSWTGQQIRRVQFLRLNRSTWVVAFEGLTIAELDRVMDGVALEYPGIVNNPNVEDRWYGSPDPSTDPPGQPLSTSDLGVPSAVSGAPPRYIQLVHPQFNQWLDTPADTPTGSDPDNLPANVPSQPLRIVVLDRHHLPIPPVVRDFILWVVNELSNGFTGAFDAAKNAYFPQNIKLNAALSAYPVIQDPDPFVPGPFEEPTGPPEPDPDPDPPGTEP